MRRFDDIGMDSPWGRSNGYVCVGQGDQVIIPVRNGYALSNYVDSIKASFWWFTDSRTSFSNPVANDIDVKFEYYSSGSWHFLMMSSGSDLKKRLYHGGVGGQTLRIVITGTDVNGDHNDPGVCDSDEARVFYLWMYEDSDRDDGDGFPDSEIEPL